MVVAPESVKQKIIINGIFIGTECIRFVEEGKNLGVYLDSILSFDSHINKVVKGCHSTLRQISRVRKFFTEHDLQILISSLVLSRIDCNNVLYYNLKASNIRKLQTVQNCAARIVCRVNRFDRVSSDSLTKKLHWLKVNERILYKILVLVHKCINRKAPNVLIASFTLSERSRCNRLVTKSFNSAFGERAFTVCGPKLWNSLPAYLRTIENINTFKEKLKTYLFKKCYNC